MNESQWLNRALIAEKELAEVRELLRRELDWFVDYAERAEQVWTGTAAASTWHQAAHEFKAKREAVLSPSPKLTTRKPDGG